jgi:hypothetical protein
MGATEIVEEEEPKNPLFYNTGSILRKLVRI